MLLDVAEHAIRYLRERRYRARATPRDTSDGRATSTNEVPRAEKSA